MIEQHLRRLSERSTTMREFAKEGANNCRILEMAFEYLCTARKMLNNEPSVAKFGFDRAENSLSELELQTPDDLRDF